MALTCEKLLSRGLVASSPVLKLWRETYGTNADLRRAKELADDGDAAEGGEGGGGGKVGGVSRTAVRELWFGGGEELLFGEGLSSLRGGGGAEGETLSLTDTYSHTDTHTHTHSAKKKRVSVQGSQGFLGKGGGGRREEEEEEERTEQTSEFRNSEISKFQQTVQYLFLRPKPKLKP